MRKKITTSRSNVIVKKFLLWCLLCLFHFSFTQAQTQSYDNFEGNSLLKYGARNGVLDTASKNPAPGKVNNSEKCAMYVRNQTKKFDNIKMSLGEKLTEVNNYSTYKGIPPKIKMKVYTSAPPGTLVEILLGSKGRNNEYPEGTHSQYQARTTVSNAWEELEFKFSQIPQGSETSETQIDQITLLFNPNSTSSDTYYFDDISGPPLSNVSNKSEQINPPINTNNKEPVNRTPTKETKK